VSALISPVCYATLLAFMRSGNVQLNGSRKIQTKDMNMKEEK